MTQTKLTISPADIGQQEANVFLGEARGYYDRTAKKSNMITLLPGSYLSKNVFDDRWIHESFAYLIREGFIEEKANVYEVIKPIWGSPSGTAAFALGRDGDAKPSGYTSWKFANGQTIDEAGERPEKNSSLVR